ncbi:carotenoid biosynthesis protein [Pseudonocardia yuanmonensis]|uniref:Carotenoid biosynthesis protein n=1 Tax=Pseudonocardia yuanmonensis TaxID=1095914 RepID=A0ABP8X8H7_9PSEU
MLRTAPLVRGRVHALTWTLVAGAVLVQIAYPLTPEALRTQVTVLSVVVFAAASLCDATRLHGARGGLLLLVVAGGGGLVAEAVGLRTGVPFGAYAYTGTLGPELLDVPLVVPLAWTMMAWPALVVGRTLARSRAGVVAVGAAALAAWDVFLDPQMVDAGHWRWLDPGPGLPLVPGIPLTNYAGWLLVSALVVAALHATLPAHDRPPAPATALYLWVYGSSVLAHLAFFGLPGSALVGGVLMGAVAIPFARAARRAGVGAGLLPAGTRASGVRP